MPTPIPRFEVDGLIDETGLDPEATPRWLMVGHTSVSSVFLADGAGMTVQVRNEKIASIQETSFVSGGRREFWITGASPGETFVEVIDPKTKRPAARLQVSVKDERPLKIAFQYVTDRLHEKTKRPSFVADDLVVELSKIYQFQANVRFKKTRALDVDVDTDLYQIILEQRNGNTRKVNREWDKVAAAGDSDADLNVFFMPWYWTDRTRPGEILEKYGVFLCVDSMSDDEVKVALPHVIGRYLGCTVVSKESQRHHVMHWDRAEGVTNLTVRRNFIPRDCANVLNPS